MSPHCLSFVYRVYCQSSLNYGMEVCFLNKKTLSHLDSCQSTLIKNNIGLSKYSRSGPLLDAIKIDKCSLVYWKMKFSFIKQVKKHPVTSSIFDFLLTHYGRSGCSDKSSFIRQFSDLEEILNIKPTELFKHEAYSILFNKFSCDERDLVNEVKRTCDVFSSLSDLREALRSLLWVEFETPAYILLDES